MSLGPPEVLLCLFVALVVLGPEQLPKAARSLGRAVGEFRKFNQALQHQMNDFINTADDSNGPLKNRKYATQTNDQPEASAATTHEEQPSVAPDPEHFRPVDGVIDTRPIAPPFDEPVERPSVQRPSDLPE